MQLSEHDKETLKQGCVRHGVIHSTLQGQSCVQPAASHLGRDAAQAGRMPAQNTQHQCQRGNFAPLRQNEKNWRLLSLKKIWGWKIMEKMTLVRVLSWFCLSVTLSIRVKIKAIENVWEGFVPVDLNFAGEVSLNSKYSFLASISVDEKIHILKLLAQIWGISYAEQAITDNPFKFVNMRLPKFH